MTFCLTPVLPKLYGDDGLAVCSVYSLSPLGWIQIFANKQTRAAAKADGRPAHCLRPCQGILCLYFDPWHFYCCLINLCALGQFSANDLLPQAWATAICYSLHLKSLDLSSFLMLFTWTNICLLFGITYRKWVKEFVDRRRQRESNLCFYNYHQEQKRWFKPDCM